MDSYHLFVSLIKQKAVYCLFLALVGLVWTPAASAIDDEECFACHTVIHDGTEEVAIDESGVPVIDMEIYRRSIHIGFGFTCVDCHTDITELPHAEQLAPVDCTTCHSDVAETYSASVHGIAVTEGKKDAPSCVRCHGSHNLLHSDDPQSPIYRMRLPRLCGECHSDPNIMGEYGITTVKQETLFRQSVHAAELLSGNEKAPTCVNCHGYHDTKQLRDPTSRTNFMNVPETCGQCHNIERDQYLRSVHGISAMNGHKDAPVCTDCHGEHGVLRVTDERSPVNTLHLSQNICARCHGSVVINDKYDISMGKVANFFDSYHGLALQHGSKRVANCSSCHGNHLILKSTDPEATTSPERLVETCGTCHPGITENVLAAPIHAEVTLRSPTIVAWVPRIYLLLIVGIIGGMLLHNGVILYALLREKFKHEKTEPGYKRFTVFEIILHILLTVSFILLVITGFALVNPNSWWVTMLSFVYMTEDVRGTIHRIAGVVLIVISLIYAVYMVSTRRGRSELFAFLASPQDIVHVWQHLAFHLGWRDEPPKFGRYDYTEKMEFWALVWGVIIMATTGLMLWFPILAFQYLPKWAIDMAELIHYYEAVLATLAIIVWHFFFVMFHPEEYPMSTTWLTGRMTLRHLKNRHRLEYEELKKKSDIDDSEIPNH